MHLCSIFIHSINSDSDDGDATSDDGDAASDGEDNHTEEVSESPMAVSPDNSNAAVSSAAEESPVPVSHRL